MTETDRANTVFTRTGHSDKVNHAAGEFADLNSYNSFTILILYCSTFAPGRVISWSTPSGMKFEHTDVKLGRAGEKAMVKEWGRRLQKIPRGHAILADRGFYGTSHYHPNYNAQLTPSFLAGRDRFTAEEVQADYEICKLRYTCEVVFARVTRESALRDVVPLLSHRSQAHTRSTYLDLDYRLLIVS